MSAVSVNRGFAPATFVTTTRYLPPPVGTTKSTPASRVSADALSLKSTCRCCERSVVDASKTAIVKSDSDDGPAARNETRSPGVAENTYSATRAAGASPVVVVRSTSGPRSTTASIRRLSSFSQMRYHESPGRRLRRRPKPAKRPRRGAGGFLCVRRLLIGHLPPAVRSRMRRRRPQLAAPMTRRPPRPPRTRPATPYGTPVL